MASGGAPSPERSARLAVGTVSWAFGATLLVRLGGGDVWWHVRTGQWMIDRGVIPATDPFAYTSEGPWKYTDALAQLLYAGVHAAAGAPGLVLLHAALGLGLALLVGALAEGRGAARALVVGLWGAASHSAMAAKPQIFSYLAFAMLLWWLRGVERQERPVRALAALPLVFLLWGNLHRGATLGLAVLGAALVAWALEPARRRAAGALAGVTALCALALVLNPGGLFYLTSTVDLATRSSFSELLADWHPLSWEHLIDNHVMLLPLLALAIAGRLDRLRRVDVEVLVVLGTAVLAARSVRFVPFFAIALAPAAGRGAGQLLRWLSARAKGAVRPSVLSALAVALGVAALGWRYTAQVPQAYWGVGVVDSRVPVRLADFLADSPPPGRMLNDFDLGGYLIYALAPEQKVFIDGRNDTVYEDAFFRRALSAATSPPTFHRLVEEHDVGFAVVPFSGPGDPRYAFVHADPRWHLVYFDDTGAVLVRDTPEARPYLREHAFRELSLHDVFPRVAQLGSRPGDRVLAREIRRQAQGHPSSLISRYLGVMLHRRLGEEQAYHSGRQDLEAMIRERDLSLPIP